MKRPRRGHFFRTKFQFRAKIPPLHIKIWLEFEKIPNQMEVKKMRRVIILLIMLLLMAIRSFPGETLLKEFNVEKGKCLDVDLRVGGSINITGWEKEKVAVTVLFKKTTPDQWDVRFKETVEGIEIEAAYKGGERDNISSPDFEIRTPSQFDLKLKTMGGAINIKGVTGEITGRTMGGPLELANLKGTIELKTMGGDITLKDSDIDGKLKTMGGRVLFENVIGDVSGSGKPGAPRSAAAKQRENPAKPLKFLPWEVTSMSAMHPTAPMSIPWGETSISNPPGTS
jgi:hypothetical protein